MSAIEVRPFRRSDRDQLTQLVNAHAGAVVPEQWPHIRELYRLAGFAHTGHTEIVYLVRTDDLPRPAAAPIEGLSVRRTVGMNGTRLSAVVGEDVIGYIEVETFDAGERLP